MNTLMNDIWPYLLTALLPAIALYVGYIHQLKLEVAVLKTTVDDLKKDLESVQKRQDSHSKKQDDILKSITDLKVEMLKEMGTVGVGMAVLVTGVWVGMVLVAKAIEKRPAPEPEAAEVQS